jgi:starch synthase
MKVAVDHSDASIIASPAVSDSLKAYVEASGKPFLPYVEKENFAAAYTNFYKNEVL